MQRQNPQASNHGTGVDRTRHDQTAGAAGVSINHPNLPGAGSRQVVLLGLLWSYSRASEMSIQPGGFCLECVAEVVLKLRTANEASGGQVLVRGLD